MEPIAQEENKDKALEEVAKRIGVTVEYLKTTPPWFQEGRAPTEDEWTGHCRGQERGCKDYVPAWPLSHYGGMCAKYIILYKHCGVPFVSKIVCKTGIPNEKGGIKHQLAWKYFRKNLDRLNREGWKDQKAPRGKDNPTEVAQMTPVGGTRYLCECCGKTFGSGRARNGPKVCGPCAGYLRKHKMGVQQMKDQLGSELENEVKKEEEAEDAS